MSSRVVYIPIRWITCNRESALSIGRDELAEKIEHGRSIELHCAYDGTRWAARPYEVIEIFKRLREAARLT